MAPSMRSAPRFKIATETWEFDQIHRLNHETFVEEITEHPRSPSGRLVDRFDDENTYAVCVYNRQLAGMVAIRGRRPFSLDQKLENLDQYLPHDRPVCELRLLAIDKRFRGRLLLPGLLAAAWQHILKQGYELAIISGVTSQLKLYGHLGFVRSCGGHAGGPVPTHVPDTAAVPCGCAPRSQSVSTSVTCGQLPSGARSDECPGPTGVQPMFLTRQQFVERADVLRGRSRSAPASRAANFLPGPVPTSARVQQAFEGPPVQEFVADLEATAALVSQHAGARHVEILLGSGTLANDAVAAQLELHGDAGLVLSNGEFGERLIDHAGRANLAHDVLAARWGDPLELSAIEAAIRKKPAIKWVWLVHCETSTGVLNDLDSLKRLCRNHDLRLCVDAISSFGTVPFDLDGVYLASTVSGKALRSFPGLSMVFHNHRIEPAPNALPRYLDLGLYARRPGSPFTHSSNLVRALRAAVSELDRSTRFEEIAQLSVWLRAELDRRGFEIIGRAAHPAPGVVTIALPLRLDAREIGRELELAGYLVSSRSQYLVARNWIQISLMGEACRTELTGLLEALDALCFDSPDTRRRALKTPTA